MNTQRLSDFSTEFSDYSDTIVFETKPVLFLQLVYLKFT